jgi:hypothetical protein
MTCANVGTGLDIYSVSSITFEALHMTTRKPSGYVIYSGPSMLDGAPIVAIAITKSSNRKTGDMLQTYILRADVSPIDAIKTGSDSSICGECVHRGTDGIKRTCYVNIGQGPTVVWKGYVRGIYPYRQNAATLGEGRMVRLGTYGDPAAVPAYVWRSLTMNAIGHTGYTHQWHTSPQYGDLCMASVDSPEEALEARAMGFRTFRVSLPSHESKMTGEVICPASKEAGAKLHCAECRACDGTTSNRRGSITIAAHGGTAVMSAIRARNDLILAA